MKCANCSREAAHVYRIRPTDSGVHYCDPCLPRFLYMARDAGHLSIPVAVEEPAVEEVAPAKSKKASKSAEQ